MLGNRNLDLAVRSGPANRRAAVPRPLHSPVVQRPLTHGLLAAVALTLGFAAPAQAIPDCPGGLVEPRVLVQGHPSKLESVVVDRRDRLFFTDGEHLLRLDAPGAAPAVVADVPVPGGVAIDDEGFVLVGFGNSPQNGLLGDLNPMSGIYRVDPESGEKTLFASGLAMANGVTRARDGVVYATNDFGSNVDRVIGGRTDPGWAKVLSGNGIGLDIAERHLFVAQTFQPPAIRRIKRSDPAANEVWATGGPEDLIAGLDGLAVDGANRIFVTANGTGEVWLVEGRGRVCALVRGLARFPDGPSNAALGRGDGAFPATSVYVVTFSGDVLELPDVAVSRAEGRRLLRERRRARAARRART